MLFGFVLFGIIVHLVLLYSIFDIYFSSPLVKNANTYEITNENGPANRLVFFSAGIIFLLFYYVFIDGLRASSFYEHSEKSPFLHHLIRNEKVALMAGFYEDVSAVARGWKHNPVAFDSTFNQSKMTWMWGSPDIVSLFSDITSESYSDTYDSKEEDFNSKYAYKLDTWVFERVENYLLLKENKEKLKTNKSIFFLHLLGLDTNGHGSKPQSKNYLENIKVVDNGIKNTVDLFENVFLDNKYILLNILIYY